MRGGADSAGASGGGAEDGGGGARATQKCGCARAAQGEGDGGTKDARAVDGGERWRTAARERERQ
jgi:hypothetical protein